MWTRAIEFVAAASGAIPYAEAKGIRTRSYYPITSQVAAKIQHLRDAAGGFAVLVAVAQPGVVVPDQPDVAHGLYLVHDSRGYSEARL